MCKIVKCFFGIDLYNDDIFQASVNISTGRIVNQLRGGTSPDKYLAVYCYKDGSTSDVTITANAIICGTRG